MKFSVLIPTHNRLEFLKYAIASVLQQGEEDLEIIISDNCSEEDIGGYISSLNDSRIKYSRTSSFVSVTENWNNALNQSSGEWIIMLGDDDCLMKGYFLIIRQLLEQFPYPDFIYSSAFLFAYPKVLPEYPNGVARIFGNAEFLSRKNHPFWLSKSEANKLVENNFNFKCCYAYNMQFSTINRSVVEKLKINGNFFHSPYPDYYATTILMMFCDKILACPIPIVGVGISPKSFGYYYFNNSENKGLEFLNNLKEKSQIPKLTNIIFPGSDMNNSWLLSLEKIKENFKECNISINYKRYRNIQIIECLRQLFVRTDQGKQQFRQVLKRMNFKEKCFYGFPWLFLCYFPKIIRRKIIGLMSKLSKSHYIYPGPSLDHQYNNIQQFFEELDPRKLTNNNYD